MSNNEIIQVDLGARAYDIVIGQGLLANSVSYLETVISFPCFIIADSNIPENYIADLKKSIGNEEHTHVIKVPSGESSKSFSGLEKLLDDVFSYNPERKATLIALGGGVVGDLTGFAASVLLRGVNFIQVPTTLLSQVDSSVGGKTGVNNRFGKNLVGSFYQPRLVLIDIDVLNSLSHREFLAGYAEVVKYGLINDYEFFGWLEANIDRVVAKEPDALKYIIAKSCAAKADIVAKDEKEGGVRALLNLGHTFGHALEQQMGYDGSLVHGEAVAIGMIFAFCLAKELGYTSDDDIKRVKEHLAKSGLPISPNQIKENWDVDQLVAAMAKDKKVVDGKLVFILPKAIGDCFIEKGVDSKIIRATIQSFLSNSDT